MCAMWVLGWPSRGKAGCVSRGWGVGGCDGGISKFSSDYFDFPIDVNANSTYHMVLLCK